MSSSSSSSFRLLLCGDVNGEKVNVETVFDRKPDMVARIADEGQAIFGSEFAKRGLDARRFVVDFIVFYDDASRQWKPLEDAKQLGEFQQLYLFQHDSNETVREIPPPSYQVAASGANTRQVHRPGVSVVDAEKVEWLFQELDGDRDELVHPDEMLFGFAVASVDFSDETVLRLFEKCDKNRDNGLTWDEFLGFAEMFPNTCETLYWRLRTIESDPSAHPAAHQLRRQRDVIADLKRRLDDAQRDKKNVERRVRQETQNARVNDPRKALVAEEEQDLMNKEFALQFHRDLVVRAEALFFESANRFNQASMKQGSPRRARAL
jgi:hypothetical protein